MAKRRVKQTAKARKARAAGRRYRAKKKDDAGVEESGEAADNWVWVSPEMWLWVSPKGGSGLQDSVSISQKCPNRQAHYAKLVQAK